MRPRIFDTIPIHDELDMLECRLTEIGDVVDYMIVVEADVTHQDTPKPWYLTDGLDRFARWKDKLIVVQATGLPTVAYDRDPWARELAQRGYALDVLADLAGPDDIVLHGDIDEIPRVLQVRNVRPKPGWFVSFEQRMHCFAVDWTHPDPWFGTVAARYSTVIELGEHMAYNASQGRDSQGVPTDQEGALNALAGMRDKRNRFTQPGSRVDPQPLLDAGWHLSWLGGQDKAFKKLRSFCHPEVADRIEEGLTADLFLREGWHVDGRKMAAVDVDGTWPKWIVDGNAPASWFRPR